MRDCEKQDPNDLPATRGMLTEVKNELTHRMDEKFSKVDARFDQMDSKIHEIKSNMSRMESKIHDIAAETARMAFLMEEQHSNNRIVLEGIRSSLERCDRIETVVNEKCR